MNVLDLFCGAAGGWSLGLERAGFRTVAACEINPWRRSVFQRRHPHAKLYDDVRTLTAERLRADLGYLPDVVVGSPPCQEISAANSKGEGITDDHLFWEWARLVFEIRPVWCAAENSPRARTAGVDGILDALASANYAAWPLVVGADNAGANHRRKRLWLFAADALRYELWQQPGWGVGTNRRSPAVAGDHDRDAAIVEGLRLGRIFRQCGAESAEADLRDDSDADGRIARRARRHADGCFGLGEGSDEKHPADSDCERYSLRPREPGDDGQELPPALRDIGIAWPHWNGGLAGLTEACIAAGFGAVDDGTEPGLPAGLRNRAIAALGDAVVPQIPEAGARAIMRAAGA